MYVEFEFNRGELIRMIYIFFTNFEFAYFCVIAESLI